MLDFDVSADFRQVERMLKRTPRVVEKAAVSALNKTNDSIESIARRMIAKDMGIPAKAVRVGMFKLKAVRHQLSAAAVGRGRPINLIRFKAKQTKKGVSASAWGKRKLYKGLFIGNKGRTVFKRTSKDRTPIRAVWGPSIPRTMLEDYIVKAMQLTASTQWQKNFSRDLRYFLNKERL